nr:MAG TPA: hypothetical protein [Caudoviricetes sp.]
MDKYKELHEHLSRLAVGARQTLLYQGEVTEVGDLTCTVEVDGLSLPDVRLRASTEVDGAELLLRPAVGSVAIIGSLTGDLDQLVLLQMDRAEEVIINGGKLGGLIKIKELTDRLNTIERDVNSLKQVLSAWTPIPTDGGASLKGAVASWVGKPLILTKRGDYEDDKVKH